MTKQERFQQKQWGQIVAKAWADADFKARLVADPQAVLREHGIEPEPGIELRVVEDSAEADLVTIDIGGATLMARITSAATRELTLAVGMPVWALVKAVSLRGRLVRHS